MKKLHFTYRTLYTFDSPIYDHYYTFKIYPRENERQRVVSLLESMDFGDSHSYSYDTFGNKTVYGNIRAPHTRFYFDISGTAFVDGTKYETDEHLLRLFLAPSSMTKTTPLLRNAFTKASSEAVKQSVYQKEMKEMTDLEKCSYLSDYCHNLLTYTPNATNVFTDASDALRLGKGVCQDYSHILIALLRMSQIPARYVVGFMLGEGYTHAWVEAFCDDRWYGFDPTNYKLVDEGYIKLSHGRDYNDTTVCKGHFYGQAKQNQEIHVQVEEV